MAKVRKVEPVFERNNGAEHPEHQDVNTRVSHYMRLYATGKMQDFPRTGMVENRELDEGLRKDLLNRNLPLPEVGTDPVEVLDFLNKNRQRFDDLVKDYNLAIDDKKAYDDAMAVLDDDNAEVEKKHKAIRVLEAIREKARARSL